MKRSNFCLLFPTLLGSLTAALPGGCEGDLGTLSINSSSLPLLWTCSSIDPSLLFGSGQNVILAAHMVSSDVQCANYCAPRKPIAAIWYPSTTDCECWEIEEITGNTVYMDSGATWIDFYFGVNIGARSPFLITSSQLSSKTTSSATSTGISTTKSTLKTSSSKTSSSTKATATSTSKSVSKSSSLAKLAATSISKSSSMTSNSKTSCSKGSSSTKSTAPSIKNSSSKTPSSTKSSVTSTSKSSLKISSSTTAKAASTIKSSSTKATLTNTSKSSSFKVSASASTFSSSKLGTSTLTSSAPASTFTGATANNVTTSPTCYQLPIPIPGLSEIPYNATKSDGSVLPLIFYISEDCKTLNYLGSMINGTSVLYDVTQPNQVAIFVDYQPIVQFTPNGMSIFGPECSWATDINIPNFYSQLKTVLASDVSPARRKRDIQLQVSGRQTSPSLLVELTLQPDCHSTTFPMPTSDQLSLLVGQVGNAVSCTLVNSLGPASNGVLSLQYNCVPPGATEAADSCQSAATSGLVTLQTNQAVQSIISTPQGIDNRINQVISAINAAGNKIGVGGKIGPVDLSWVVQEAMNSWLNKVSPGLSSGLNAINWIDKIGTGIDDMTTADVQSACAGLFNSPYNAYLQFTQNSIGPSTFQLASFNLASTTFLFIQAPLWINPSYGEVEVRCWKSATGNFSPGAQCAAAPVCSTGSCQLETQQCGWSLCCTRASSYCVNPATCAAT